MIFFKASPSLCVLPPLTLNPTTQFYISCSSYRWWGPTGNTVTSFQGHLFIFQSKTQILSQTSPVKQRKCTGQVSVQPPVTRLRRRPREPHWNRTGQVCLLRGCALTLPTLKLCGIHSGGGLWQKWPHARETGVALISFPAAISTQALVRSSQLWDNHTLGHSKSGLCCVVSVSLDKS